jgi:hypothetical protein
MLFKGAERKRGAPQALGRPPHRGSCPPARAARLLPMRRLVPQLLHRRALLAQLGLRLDQVARRRLLQSGRQGGGAGENVNRDKARASVTGKLRMAAPAGGTALQGQRGSPRAARGRGRSLPHLRVPQLRRTPLQLSQRDAGVLPLALRRELGLLGRAQVLLRGGGEGRARQLGHGHGCGRATLPDSPSIPPTRPPHLELRRVLRRTRGLLLRRRQLRPRRLEVGLLL